MITCRGCERGPVVMLIAAKHLDTQPCHAESTLVILNEVKNLAAPHVRPFAEFTLSVTNVLRVAGGRKSQSDEREHEESAPVI